MTREREYFFGEDRGRMGGGGMGMGMGLGMGRPGMGGGGGFQHKSQAVKALKETMQSGHRTGLPPMLLDYFAPRPMPPKPTLPPRRKQHVPFQGVAHLVGMFAGPQDPEEVDVKEDKPRLFRNPELALQCRLTTETKQEKQIRLSEWKRDEAATRAEEASKAWDPNRDPKAEGDPFRTLFVSRLSYDVNEKRLRKEFEQYGPIKRVRIVTDKNGKSRGYGFIEFEDKKDMKEAYKAADGRKIEARRVLVDVERGRTVETWKPRRLGGGLGAEGRAPRPPKKAARGAVMGTGMGFAPPPMGMDRPMMGGGRPPRERTPPGRMPPGPVGGRDAGRDAGRDFRDRDRDRVGDRDRERKREREPTPPRRDRERPSERERGSDPKRRRDGDELEAGERRDRSSGGDRDARRRY